MEKPKIENEKIIIPIYYYIDEEKNKTIIDEEEMLKEFENMINELKMNSNKYIK